MKSKVEILKTIKLFVSDIFCSESKTFFFNLFRFGLVSKTKQMVEKKTCLFLSKLKTRAEVRSGDLRNGRDGVGHESCTAVEHIPCNQEVMGSNTEAFLPLSFPTFLYQWGIPKQVLQGAASLTMCCKSNN